MGPAKIYYHVRDMQHKVMYSVLLQQFVFFYCFLCGWVSVGLGLDIWSKVFIVDEYICILQKQSMFVAHEFFIDGNFSCILQKQSMFVFGRNDSLSSKHQHY